MLDTNILSHYMRGTPGLAHRFIQHSGQLAIPTVVLAELYAGAYLLKNPGPLQKQIADLLSFIELIGFDAASAEVFGRLRGELHGRGLVVPPIDLMIASVAIGQNLLLVTHNTADFVNIPDLRVVDWIAP